MPSTTPLTDAINALTQYANETTGASDTTLSDAVGTLVAGYGGGGGYSIDEFADGSITGDITITATNIRERAFKATNVTGVTAPNVTILREQIFNSCTRLTKISFPNATSINSSQQFLGCSALTDINLPKLAVPGGNMFQACTNLEIVDFPEVTRMNINRVFYGCYKLHTLILRNTSVVSVNNDTLGNTPFAGYNGLSGTVYVPQSLISSYQTAANWSTLYNGGHCTFAAIEGSQYE